MNDFKMREVADMKASLITLLKSQLSNIETANTDEVYKVVDIIKDLAETEKYCYEACYYKSVIDAMEEGSEDRYGYSAPKGNYRMSGRMGYRPMVDQEPYIDAYLHDPNFKDRMYDKSNRYGYIRSEDMNSTLSGIKDIWMNADPDKKMHLKRELSNMIDNID